MGYILNPYPLIHLRSPKGNLVVGVATGLLVGIMVHFSWTINSYHLTTCMITVTVAYYLSGLLAALIASSSIVIFYVSMFYNAPDFNAFKVIFLICISLATMEAFNAYAAKRQLKPKIKWWFFVFTAMLLTNYFYLNKDFHDLRIPVMVLGSISFILIAGIEYMVLNYIMKMNTDFHRVKSNSTTDFLTQLNNTRHFETLFKELSNKIVSTNGTLSCLMLDLDHFKKINDTYGHPVGDLVLKEVASLLHENIRGSDVVGRIGGEEFCILLNCDLQKAVEIGEKLRKLIEALSIKTPSNQDLKITVSIGVANYPESTIHFSKLKKLADNSLYVAKNSGRNRVCADEV